jgi:response regulator RpfG family c-di-GMP phosphodiesterase
MFEFFREEKEKKIEDANELKSEDLVFRQRVLASLEQVGFHESLQEEIISRLILLEKGSRFNEYSRRIERGMENVLNLLETRYAEKYPETVLSKKQRSDGRIAAILHDIGKSGPVDAAPEEQEVIIKIFACENIRNSELLVVDATHDIFEADQVANAKQTLGKYGIDDKTTMRKFWDRHAEWTHDILERYSSGLSEHTRIIAGSHHIDRGVNPYALPESEVPLSANVIGTLEDYVEALEERSLIALDQYEASIKRGGLSHDDALSRVREGMVKYKNDELMSFVLEAIDELGKKEMIFS